MRPGPAWRELLLAPEAADWLLGLLPALRGAAAAQPLARAARQLLARRRRHCIGSDSMGVHALDGEPAVDGEPAMEAA